ncbi:hypothetical protein JTE90_023102 [Oedothorax gibbosus]|uniref:Uncharacterized protein n=1 Tax=Oedothorax gibbosus TaxID=931172 RepID=A0AAV6TWW3_9ARAC|nr:hypothetical protein JTE90_023102 [Oedothorax gibbosus]
MSDLGKDLLSSSPSMSSAEVDACVEQCFNFIHKSKNLCLCNGDFGQEGNTTKTGHQLAAAPKAALRLQEPTSETEEAVISFEDAKSDAVAVQRAVKCYNLEQLIEVELKEIKNSKLVKHESLDTTPKPFMIESMDFTELEKKAAELPGVAGREVAQRQEEMPVLKSTDTLEVLLHAYEYYNVDSTKISEANLSVSEIKGRSSNPSNEIKGFQLFLVNEMKIIYDRISSIYPLRENCVPTNVDTPNSSPENSNTKNSSSSKITSEAVQSSGAEGYPELSGDSSSASGLLNDPVIDMSAAQPASKSSGGESDNTTSSTLSEDNTLSGVSSIPTDARASVSSLRDLDQMVSPSSLDSRTSLEVYPRTSVSSVRDPNNRTSVGVESLGPMSPKLQQAMLEDDSDDAFLNAPQESNASPGGQNPRRRGLLIKED